MAVVHHLNGTALCCAPPALGAQRGPRYQRFPLTLFHMNCKYFCSCAIGLICASVCPCPQYQLNVFVSVIWDVSTGHIYMQSIFFCIISWWFTVYLQQCTCRLHIVTVYKTWIVFYDFFFTNSSYWSWQMWLSQWTWTEITNFIAVNHEIRQTHLLRYANNVAFRSQA